MISSVIVTVKGERGEYDLELPADKPISALVPELEDAINTLGESYSGKINLRVGNTVLQDNKTLDQHFVWDGSIITIEATGVQW